MLRRTIEIYRQSRKQQDNFWTEVLSRPFAAALLVLLERGPITPNQVTFLSIFTALGAAALLVLWPGWAGLMAGALVLQLSYVLDCADGQLARLRGISSPVGHLLDFLMDEIKAFVVLAAVSTRVFLIHGSVEQLLLGFWGLVVVASGISLTTFLRRPEYLEVTRSRPKDDAGDARTGRSGPIGLAVRAAERFARFLIHYPSYFLYLAVFDRVEWYLYIYVGVNTLYLARAFLGVALALGRFGFDPRPAVRGGMPRPHGGIDPERM